MRYRRLKTWIEVERWGERRRAENGSIFVAVLRIHKHRGWLDRLRGRREVRSVRRSGPAAFVIATESIRWLRCGARELLWIVLPMGWIWDAAGRKIRDIRWMDIGRPGCHRGCLWGWSVAEKRVQCARKRVECSCRSSLGKRMSSFAWAAVWMVTLRPCALAPAKHCHELPHRRLSTLARMPHLAAFVAERRPAPALDVVASQR